MNELGDGLGTPDGSLYEGPAGAIPVRYYLAQPGDVHHIGAIERAWVSPSHGTTAKLVFSQTAV